MDTPRRCGPAGVRRSLIAYFYTAPRPQARDRRGDTLYLATYSQSASQRLEVYLRGLLPRWSWMWRVHAGGGASGMRGAGMVAGPCNPRPSGVWYGNASRYPAGVADCTFSTGHFRIWGKGMWYRFCQCRYGGRSCPGQFVPYPVQSLCIGQGAVADAPAHLFTPFGLFYPFQCPFRLRCIWQGRIQLGPECPGIGNLHGQNGGVSRPTLWHNAPSHAVSNATASLTTCRPRAARANRAATSPAAMPSRDSRAGVRPCNRCAATDQSVQCGCGRIR
ncbi:hypothetical protein RAA17_23495 [Komagataeibacter rhaeticus]|nr:hypothetical protein [Komagataeibacter rhaeticus]